MRSNWKKLMATTAALAALSGGAVFAQSERPESESQQGPTADGEPMNMMTMMGRMNEMMERMDRMMQMCNDMMAQMQQEQAETPAEGDAR